MAHGHRGAVSARRAAAPRVHERPLNAPGARPSRQGSRTGHSGDLAESDFSSPGATHRARTHPERISPIGAYRRRALERESRACGGFPCFSGLSSVNFGREAKSVVSSAGTQVRARHKTARQGRSRIAQRRHRTISPEIGAQETHEPAKPSFSKTIVLELPLRICKCTSYQVVRTKGVGLKSKRVRRSST